MKSMRIRGFSLVEVMIAAGVAAILVIGGLFLFSGNEDGESYIGERLDVVESGSDTPLILQNFDSYFENAEQIGQELCLKDESVYQDRQKINSEATMFVCKGFSVDPLVVRRFLFPDGGVYVSMSDLNFSMELEAMTYVDELDEGVTYGQSGGRVDIGRYEIDSKNKNYTLGNYGSLGILRVSLSETNAQSYVEFVQERESVLVDYNWDYIDKYTKNIGGLDTFIVTMEGRLAGGVVTIIYVFLGPGSYIDFTHTDEESNIPNISKLAQ